MKLAARILLAVLIIMGAGFYYLTQDVLKNIRLRYLEGVEESLVDQSRLLSSMISHDMAANAFSAKELHRIFDHAYDMTFSSQIYQLKKQSVDLRVYITDAKGTILFDSKRIAAPGTDFSQWRDVYLTLQGKYGARSSRKNPEKESSTVLYVAAPVMVKGKIAGVVTVAKPTRNINNFIS
ncbi:MAG: two-component system sensor histidine kinase CreC, partial [Desulfobacteraceae bacterium]|nr:two-component system sensor histidine kinase CreC [Desulfobacteraceae bacterium]